MIAISLSEKNAIRERFPRVLITRTMKGDSKRHHYYMEEARAPMRMLAELRGYKTEGRKHGPKRPYNGKRRGGAMS